MVLYDAIVHHGDAAAAIAMRMAVGFGGWAMGGPAGVGDAGSSDERLVLQLGGQVFQLARSAPDADIGGCADTGVHRHAGGVIAAVFEPFEGRQQHLSNVFWSDRAGDSAHVGSSVGWHRCVSRASAIQTQHRDTAPDAGMVERKPLVREWQVGLRPARLPSLIEKSHPNRQCRLLIGQGGDLCCRLLCVC